MQSKTILTIACFTALHTLARAQDKSTEKDVLTIYKGAHSYKEVSVAGKPTEVYVDEKRVADSEAPHYDSLIQVMRTDVDGDNWDRTRDDQMDRDQEQAERNQQQRERDQERAERDQENRERDVVVQEQDRVQAVNERVQAQTERVQAVNDRVQAKFDRIQAKFDRVQAKEERAAFRNLIQFLVDKHIVADRDHLSTLVFTDTALYVNGAKQPQAIHQTLKEQYSHWAQCGLSYGDSQAPGTSVFFSRPWDCCR